MIQASLPALSLELEFTRAQQAGDPFAFRFAPQEYLLRSTGGGFLAARFEWDTELLSDLDAARRPGRPRDVLQRIGERLRCFVTALGWEQQAQRISEAVREGREILLTVRSAAAELYALPWELLTLKASGQHVGELPGLLVRYEWPETTSAPEHPEPRPEGSRILLAWSAAGGAVPASAHIDAITQACSQSACPFLPPSDVLPNASLDRIRAALEAGQRAGRPVSVLHLLCHGGESEGTFCLVLDPESPRDRQGLVDAGRLRQIVAPYAATLRLVVLMACDSGNTGQLGNQLGSVAQALHRAGIAAVVASRYPLSISGSIRFCESFYSELISTLRSLEASLCSARIRLAADPANTDWLSLQCYGRSSDGSDSRPLVFRPFRGLLPFTAEYGRFFFGRDREITEVAEDLRRLESARKPRFLLIAGASGTGKSSLVLAGAVPKLLTEKAGRRLSVMRPGSSPLSALEAALSGRTEGTLLILLVDQMEEVFTQTSDPAERTAFARRLWSLASDPESGVSVLATLRVDFIGRCGEIELDENGLRLDRIAYDEEHRVFIAQLGPEALRTSITEPLALVGLALEPGLCERILKDLGQEPGGLPLLQDTLDLLWQRRRGRLLTQEAYTSLGGVLGALQGRADSLIASLGIEEQRIAQELLLRLVQITDDVSMSTRRRVALLRLRPKESAAAARFDAVLDTLVAARLLVRDGSTDGQTVEVAHEALIRSWHRLKEWVAANRERLLLIEKLEARVRECASSGLLLIGKQLAEAASIAERFRADCSEEALSLIAQSEARARRRKRIRMFSYIGAGLAVLVFWQVGAAARKNQQIISEQEQRLAQEGRYIRDASRMYMAQKYQHEPATVVALLREVETEPAERLAGWQQMAMDALVDPNMAELLDDKQETEREHPDEQRRERGGDEGSNLPDADEQEVKELASTKDRSRTLRIWENGRLEVQFKDKREDFTHLVGRFSELRIDAARFNRDGSQFLTVSADRTVRIWLSVGSTPTILQGTLGREVPAAGYSFSADSTRVRFQRAKERSEVQFQWRITDGPGARQEIKPTFACGRGQGLPAGWLVPQRIGKRQQSPDGRWSFDEHQDRVISDGRGQLILHGFEDPGHVIAFSADSERLMTCTLEGRSYAWDLSSRLLRKKLWLATGMCLSLERRMRLLGEPQALAEKNLHACNQMVSCLGTAPDPRGTGLPLRGDQYEACLARR